MKKALGIILICLSSFLCNAQIYHLYGDKTYGGNARDELGYIRLYDDFLIIGGQSRTNINGDKSDSLCNAINMNHSDLWLLQIDTAFNILWQNDVGGNLVEHSPFVFISDSNKLYFASTSASDSTCDKSDTCRGQGDYWFGELNSSGNLIWEQTLGGSLSDGGTKIIQLANEFIIAGQSSSGISGDKTVPVFGNSDFWIVKSDSDGTIIWDKEYGSSGSEMGDGQNYDILQIDNTNFLLAGNTFGSPSGQVIDTSRGNRDFWIVKIDSSGAIIWQKRYGGNSYELAKRAISTNDNYFILAGYTNSLQNGEVSQPSLGGDDFWIVKLDTSGNLIWDKRYGGAGDERAYWIEETADGGFWVSGTTTSGAGGQISEPAYGTTDYWIIRIDSLGNLLWDKRFGGPGDNLLTSFSLLADSSIMLFGYADSGTSTIKTDTGKGDTDYWLVHFYYGSSPVGINETIQPDEFSVYPNPSTGEINIPKELMNSNLVISDVTGRLVFYQMNIQSTALNFAFLPKGYYLLQFRSDSSNFNAKWLKL